MPQVPVFGKAYNNFWIAILRDFIFQLIAYIQECIIAKEQEYGFIFTIAGNGFRHQGAAIAENQNKQKIMKLFMIHNYFCWCWCWSIVQSRKCRNGMRIFAKFNFFLLLYWDVKNFLFQLFFLFLAFFFAFAACLLLLPVDDRLMSNFVSSFSSSLLLLLLWF